MGFFTKDSTPSPDGADGLAPLSKDRIKHGLEAQGWSYSVDSDGDIGGGWEYASFCFMLNGKEDELLCIRGSWRGQLVADEFANIAGRSSELVRLVHPVGTQFRRPGTVARFRVF